MTRHSPRRTAARAFTLIELLVVVGIILLLVGILVPALTGARRAGQRSSTSSLMNTISQAIGTYQTDNQSLPGYFSQDEMGHSDNANRGFTQMENALLSLMGGVTTDSSDCDPGNPAGANIITVGPTGGSTVNVAIALMGATPGADYLSPGSFLKPTVEQSNDDACMGRMPDILDAFGTPIIMWMRNTVAPSGAPFVAESSSTPARFYWNSNAGYLNAATQSDSLLRGNAPNLLESLEAVVGHPAFPQSDALGRPAQARGEIILQSAGADGVFLNHDNRYDQALYQTQGNLPSGDWRQIAKFDDIIIAGGG